MKIYAVVVTYNRLEELKECLKKYDFQKEYVDKLIVVNNFSNDGTKEYLKKWEENQENFTKKVLNLEKNLGGSGGFAKGIEFAMKDGADWIWLHDDDAFIFEDTLLNLKKAIEENDTNNISAICGQVIDHDSIAYDHRRRLKKSFFKNKEIIIKDDEYNQKSFELNEFSYVGTAINVDKLFKVGITNEDFFIFLDDTEHSYRLSTVGKILCYPEIKIKHDNKYQTSDHISNWKLYYSIRNNVYFSKHCLGSGTCYWLIYFLMTAIFKLIYRKDRVGAMLVLTAIKDGMNGNMGINAVYKPGWKPERS